MAKWKKVVVSGSTAALNSLTLDTQLAVTQGGTGLNDLSTGANKALTVNSTGDGFIFADASAPLGTISASAEGTAQGTIALNGVDVNINNMQTDDSPQFASLELGNAADTTITRVSAGLIAVEGNNLLRATGDSVISGSEQVVASTFDNLQSISTFSGSAESRITTLEEAGASAPAGTISGSAEGTVQGTISLNDVDVNIKDMQTTSKPQFAELELGDAADTTITRVAAGQIAVEGNNLLRADGDNVISGSAEGSAQGTIQLNGVDVDIKDMQTDDSPTFVGLSLTGNANIAGDLVVQGTASFQNTQNLLVSDKFIMLASGSGAATDGGIVVEQNSAGGGKGAVFAYDGVSTGRWGINLSFSPTASAYDPQAFMSAVVEGGTGVDTPAAVASDYVKKGNIFVGNNEDIYIYS